MTDKEKAEKLWQESSWWCIECDGPIDEKEDAFLHPQYDNEIVCEDCHSRYNSLVEPDIDELLFS